MNIILKRIPLLLLILSKSYLSGMMDSPKKVLGKRPETVQAFVDRAFEKNRRSNPEGWQYGGDETYGLLGLDDEEMIKNLASRFSDKDDVYVIDVGCGNGRWGYHALRILSENKNCQMNGKRFYIFSVTGDIECEETILRKGNVTLYQFNNFKIENIDEEFLKKGFDLKNKVDLIVSRWTLRHLADPFGTLKRMYGLLTPLQGILVSNGFLFAFADTGEIESFPLGNWDLFTNTNAVPLFYPYDAGRDVGHFLLMKNNDKDLDIPLEYTGEMRILDWGWQCESNAVTVFKKQDIRKDEKLSLILISDTGLGMDTATWFCNKHDLAGQELFAKLKEKGLFFIKYVSIFVKTC